MHILTKSLPLIMIHPNQSCENIHFTQILSFVLATFPISYAGTMLNGFAFLLCSKLCWHNRPNAIEQVVTCIYNITILIIDCYTTSTKNACELYCMISAISFHSHSKLQNKQIRTLSQTHFQYSTPLNISFFQHYLTRDLQKARPVKVETHNLQIN